MTTLPPHRKTLSPRRQYAIAAAVSCAGVVCSVTLLLVLRLWERARIADDFDRAAADRVASLKGDLEVHNLIVSSLQALFKADEEVDSTEFRNFTAPLLRQEPSIQALEWIPRVKQADRAAFEASARREVRSDFRLTERTERGPRVRPEVQEYFPVHYVEPYRGNEPALGFDVGSNLARREALERACRTGLAAATAPILLVQEKGSELGYLVFMPVYQRDLGPSASFEERRASLKGFALGVFRVVTTLNHAVGHLNSAGIDIYLFDSTDPRKAQFLCFRPSPAGSKPLALEEYLRGEPPGGLRREETFEVAGRNWTVMCTPIPSFVASRTTWLPWAGLAGGVMLTAMLTLYLGNTARHIARVGRLMDEAVAANRGLTSEIATRKRVEEALRESQDRFSQVARNTGEWIWEVDAEGLYTYSSPAVEAILGYKPEDFVGKKHFYDFFSPSEKPALLNAVAEAMAQKKPFRSWVNMNVHRNGNVVWLETSGVPRLDEKGHVVGYRGVDRDVTKRRRDEEALRESREFLSKIINCIRDPIFVMDEQDRFVLVNDAMRELHARPSEEIVGKTTHDLFPAELADQYRRINEEVLATGLDNTTEESTIDAQGRHLIVVTKESRHVGPDGRRYVVGILRDITESKRLENELRQSHDLLEQRVRERTAELVAANQQIRRAQTDLVHAGKMSMLGLLAAGVAHEINTPTGAILNVAADSYDHLRRLVGLGGAFTEFPPPTRDWMARLLEEVLGGVSVRSEPAVRAERRRVELQLRRGGAANPRRLSEAIVSCGLADRMDECLLQHLAQEPVLAVLEHVLAMKAACDITQSSAKKIARIVRALRSYSREESAASGRFDVNESIDNTLVILQHRLKHIPEVGIHLAEGLPPAACGPELAQVWTNLLNNACDAIELSRPQRPGRIEVSTRLDGGSLVAAFSNSGPPIPEEVMRKMYEPFFTTKPANKGTGLGLSICANIVERCGGTISARNGEDLVTFEVSVPAGEARDGVSAPDRPASPAEVGPTSPGGRNS